MALSAAAALASLVLRAKAGAAVLAVLLAAALCLGLWAMNHGWRDRAFIRWDGKSVTVREGGLRPHTVSAQGCSIQTRLLNVNGRRSEYMWILDDSGAVAMLKPELWPKGELVELLRQAGCDYDPSAPLQETTPRKLHRQDKRLVPFMLAHPLLVATAGLAVAFVVASVVIGVIGIVSG